MYLGPHDNGKAPDRLHFCTTNLDNDTTDIGLPWKFSAMYNASIETGKSSQILR